MTHLAVLGASSHIAKNLIMYFSNKQYKEDFVVYAFSRNIVIVKSFFEDNNCDINIFELRDFGLHHYDVIINCIGVADPEKQKNLNYEIFKVNEVYDCKILDYLDKNKDTLYIYFSSGAVFGNNFQEPVSETSKTTIDANNIRQNDYYPIIKLYTEAKHRSYEGNIVDLRIYSFFSRYIDLKAKFLMSEIAECLLKNKVFSTTASNITRDYISPSDLVALLLKLINIKKINNAYDVYSKAPVSKMEILSILHQKYKLSYSIKEVENNHSAFSDKNEYFTTNYGLKNIGYIPQHTSLETICSELDYLVAEN